MTIVHGEGLTVPAPEKDGGGGDVRKIYNPQPSGNVIWTPPPGGGGGSGGSEGGGNAPPSGGESGGSGQEQ